jgi:glutaredoxin
MTHITVLTKPDCPLCDHAKDTLATLADEYQLIIEIVPVESHQGRKLAASSGMAFPPAVFVEGRPFSFGRLSERKLRRALRQLNASPA